MGRNLETRFSHDFYGTLSELEVALCIDGEDYASRDIDAAMKRIKLRLQKQYAIDLSGSIEDLYSASVIGSEVKDFLDNLQFMYNRIAGCCQYFRFIGEIPVNLSKINYMGITKDSMLSVLKLLQCEGRHESLKNPMEQIKAKIGTIPMSEEKKLFMCLYVSYSLELYELTAALAEIIYLGGI